jgi:hypothetical protein
VRVWDAIRRRGRRIDGRLARSTLLRPGDRVVQCDAFLGLRAGARTGTLVRPARVGLYPGWVVRLDKPGRFSRSGTARIAYFALQPLSEAE